MDAVAGRLDFIYFACGILFAVLALAITPASSRGWRTTAIAAGLQAAAEFSRALSLSFAVLLPIVPILQLVSIIVSIEASRVLASRRIRMLGEAWVTLIGAALMGVAAFGAGIERAVGIGVPVACAALLAAAVARGPARSLGVAIAGIMTWALAFALGAGHPRVEAIRLGALLLAAVSLVPSLARFLCRSPIEVHFATDKIQRRARLSAVIGLLVLGAGGFFAEIAGNRRAKDLDRSMMLRVTAIAGMLHGGAPVDGAPADSDPLRHAAADLNAMLAGDPSIRFLYVLTERNGRIEFVVDGTDPRSPDYSRPGDVYEEATDFMRRLFRDPRPIVEPPSQDRWGVWTTAWAPVWAESRRLAGLLGMDMEATDYLREILASRLIAMLISGAALSFVVVWTVITLQEDRRLLSDRLSSLLQNELGESAVILDLDGRVLFANRSLSDLAGISCAKLEGTEFCDIAGSENARAMQDLIRDAVSGGMASARIAFARRRAEVRWSFRRFTPRPGMSDVLIGIGHDITQLRIAQKAAEVEKTFSEHVVSHSPLLVLAIGAQGELSYMNTTAEQFTGRTIKDIGTRDWARRLMPQDSDWQLQRILEESRRDGVMDFPLPLLNAQGERRVLAWNSVSREDERGIKQIILLGMDVTERDRAKEELQDYADNLRRLQSETARQAAELAAAYGRLGEQNKELELARQVAEQANSMKSEFLANTSHELRTPLNSIMGFLQLVMSGAAESREEELEFVRTAHNSSQHLLSLINDVLDIAKIEAGRLTVQIEEVDLGGIFAEVEVMTRVQAEQKKLALRFDAPEPTLCKVTGDAQRLKQVMLNLMGNAIKFTAKGSVTVSAKAGAGNGQVIVTVKDSGVGVAPENQARLFQPFVQADSRTTRRYGGTGLGLAISRRLIEMMGGSLSLESAGEGMGTTMVLTLNRWAGGA